MNKISEIIQNLYADSSLEIQKKVQFLTKNNIIMLIFSILLILDNILGDFHLIGFLTGTFAFICVSLIFFFVYKKSANTAVYGYILLLVALVIYYVLGDLITRDFYTYSRLSEFLTFILSTILFVGLFALNRKHIIIHGILANISMISHFLVITTRFYPEGDPDGIYYLILALFVINVSSYCSLAIFNLNHNLMEKIIETETEKLEAMAKVMDGFIPICAKCKAIRQEDGTWDTIEKYMTDRSETIKFSHGLCEKCFEIMNKELDTYQ